MKVLADFPSYPVTTLPQFRPNGDNHSTGNSNFVPASSLETIGMVCLLIAIIALACIWSSKQ